MVLQFLLGANHTFAVIILFVANGTLGVMPNEFAK